MNYILDTNVIIALVRGNDLGKKIIEEIKPYSALNKVFLSIVTVAELQVFSAVHNWGQAKMELLYGYFDNSFSISIDNDTLLLRYLDIELYNHNRHPGFPRAGSHYKMGKNDIWIAATAIATDSTLITTDRDFEHLNNLFLPIIFV